MSAPRYARLATKVLVSGSRGDGPPPSTEARGRAVEAIAHALSARARRRRWLRWGATAAGAAAMVAATAGVSRHVLRRDAAVAAAPNSSSAGAGGRPVQIVAHPLGEGASVVVSGNEAPLADGRQLSEGSRLVTPPSGRATLAFSTGTSVTLAEATDLTVNVDGATQRLRLAGGSVDLHVAKLVPGQRFLVDTADTEVEVRGTRFSVTLVRPNPACGGGTPTRVAVTEGVVSVRHDGIEVRVPAGEQWPAGCASAANTSGNGGGSAGSYRAAAGKSAGPIAAGSTLPEQNDLFAEAMTAKQQGNAREALAALDRLMLKYPTSPLAENASAERMRLLRATSPARAVAAAKQYIASYPNGFAYEEAEAIVARSQ